MMRLLLLAVAALLLPGCAECGLMPREATWRQPGLVAEMEALTQRGAAERIVPQGVPALAPLLFNGSSIGVGDALLERVAWTPPAGLWGAARSPSIALTAGGEVRLEVPNGTPVDRVRAVARGFAANVSGLAGAALDAWVDAFVGSATPRERMQRDDRGILSSAQRLEFKGALAPRDLAPLAAHVGANPPGSGQDVGTLVLFSEHWSFQLRLPFWRAALDGATLSVNALGHAHYKEEVGTMPEAGYTARIRDAMGRHGLPPPEARMQVGGSIC